MTACVEQSVKGAITPNGTSGIFQTELGKRFHLIFLKSILKSSYQLEEKNSKEVWGFNLKGMHSKLNKNIKTPLTPPEEKNPNQSFIDN